MLETQLVIGFSLLLLGWFGVGYWVNLRYKSRILRSLAGALGEELTKNARYTSLGSSGFIVEARGKGGYPRVGVTVVLGKREFPIMWLLDYVRGRRDRFELIVEKLRSEACIGCLCFNLKSYWGRLLYKKSGVSLGEGGWVCRGNVGLWGKIRDKTYFLQVRARKDKCYIRVIGDPHGIQEIVRQVV